MYSYGYFYKIDIRNSLSETCGYCWNWFNLATIEKKTKVQQM